MSTREEELDEVRREAERWEQELGGIARDKKGLVWVLVVGAVAAPAVGFGLGWIWGLSALALTVTAWGTGHYMFAARRAEFEEQLGRTRASERELEEAVARAATPATAERR